MPRKLSPAEREARRRERIRHSFSDAAYTHYNTSEGYGDSSEWEAAAEALASGLGILGTIKPNPKIHPDLALLYLDHMPMDINELKKAFHNTLMLVHPDHGGTTEACRAVLEAFARLSKQYSKI